MSAGTEPAPPVGVLGGTFDPIHHGHLRLAVELREKLMLREIRLIPNGYPPHRDTPSADTARRIEWIRSSIVDEPGLVLDEREYRRHGKSYTVDTLASLREEMPHTPLCLVLGMDTFRGLTTWHEWRRLLDLAHLVVAPRPGVEAPATGPLGELVRERGTSDYRDLHQRNNGLVYECDTTPLAISATEIRRLLNQGQSVRYLLPDQVWREIQGAGIYRK